MEQTFNLGDYLRTMRIEKGQTLHQLAMEVNIDSPMLSKIERGNRLPTQDQLKKLTDYFQASEENLKTLLTAERIIKEYGINDITYQAIKKVEKELSVLLKV